MQAAMLSLLFKAACLKAALAPVAVVLFIQVPLLLFPSLTPNSPAVLVLMEGVFGWVIIHQNV